MQEKKFSLGSTNIKNPFSLHSLWSFLSLSTFFPLGLGMGFASCCCCSLLFSPLLMLLDGDPLWPRADGAGLPHCVDGADLAGGGAAGGPEKRKSNLDHAFQIKKKKGFKFEITVQDQKKNTLHNFQHSWKPLPLYVLAVLPRHFPALLPGLCPAPPGWDNPAGTTRHQRATANGNVAAGRNLAANLKWK